jgi:hypothetical protein
MSQLIINPFKRGCSPEIDIMSLIVGFSRVRNSSNLRFLPIPLNAPASPFQHLKQLKSNDDFRLWWAGFNENGEWSQALSLQASRINHRQTNRVHGAPTPRSVRETSTSTTAQRQSRTRTTPRIRVNENTTQTTANNEQNTQSSTITQHQQSRTRTTHQRRTATSNQQTQFHTSNADTASPFFVPFLCAVKEYHHPNIDEVKQYVTEEIWEIMIRRTQYVHRCVQDIGNNNDKMFINNWPWDLHHNNAPMYINAHAQERLLGFEEQYSDMLHFPANCTHVLLIPGVTSGNLLMQYFNDWNAVRN